MLFDPKQSLCKMDAPCVVSPENGNKHIVKRISEYKLFQYHIDGGILTSSGGKRCDFIVEAITPNDPAIAFVIELKGSDLDAAIVQIEETIKQFSAILTGYQVRPRIVLHKVRAPAINGSNFRKLKKCYPDTKIGTRELTDKI